VNRRLDQRARRVWNDQVFVVTQQIAEPLAFRTGAQGMIEGKPGRSPAFHEARFPVPPGGGAVILPEDQTIQHDMHNGSGGGGKNGAALQVQQVLPALDPHVSAGKE
jgi:hypothetical protein